jgi:NTE family protein
MRSLGGGFVRRFRRHYKINLALQGGGAHGAFTWGVLDRLLEDPEIEFSWISAASAGSVNAVAAAAGLASGSREAARDNLKRVWEAVYKAGVPDFLRLNPFLYGLTRSTTLAQVATLWSPYDFNPLGFDPLRRLLTETIDFDKLRTNSPVELLIAATEVATGKARLFRRAGVTVEAVCASCCLPTLHHAVEIDGAAYWDGGFSANPDLVTLALESPVRDTLMVIINPLVKPGTPTGVREISGHANRLTFNAPLLRDVEIITTVRETMRGLFRPRKGRLRPLALHRYHVVEAGRYTASLSDESKLKPDWTLFTYLFSAGRDEASKWLDRHKRSIGRRETADLKARFLDANAETTVVPAPAAAPGFERQARRA